MEYTKGEWKYTRPQVGTASGVICTLVEPHYMPDCGDRTWYNGQVEVMEANAYLIAAAPKQNQALIWVAEWLGIREPDGEKPNRADVVRIVIEALQKAEGR